MPQAFRMYRIVCTITDKALVSGSDHPHRHLSGPGFKGRYRGEWYERGSWSKTGGVFWKTEWSVKGHLKNLCHDWDTKHTPSQWPRYEGQCDWWHEIIPNSLDWSRLQHLVVETFHVTEYSTMKVAAADFMGIPDQQVA